MISTAEKKNNVGPINVGPGNITVNQKQNLSDSSLPVTQAVIRQRAATKFLNHTESRL